MRFDKGHLLSAVAGLIAGGVFVAVLPAVAANDDLMVVGGKNNAIRATKLISKGGLYLRVGKAGNPALTIEVVGDTPPMAVNSSGLVDNLNADLLDGLDASDLVAAGQECLPGWTPKGFDDDGVIRCAGVATIAPMGQYPSYTSLQLDSSGFPVIAFYNSDANTLNLAHCTDRSCTGAVVNTVDDSGDVGEGASLALDSQGFPVISYQDVDARDLKVAHCADADCAATPTIKTVETDGNTGFHTSILLDGSGYPVIAYFDGDPNLDLKVAHCLDVDCAAAVIETVDSDGTVGLWPSLALDAVGYPVISYFDDTAAAVNLAHCTDAFCTAASVEAVDSAVGNGYSSLVLDASGYPVIAYWTSIDLKLAHCSDATCTVTPTISTVDANGFVGYQPSMALDSAGYPVIAYQDGELQDLMVAYCQDADCDDAVTHRVDTIGDAGSWSSLVLNGSGDPVISYLGHSEALRVAFP